MRSAVSLGLVIAAALACGGTRRPPAPPRLTLPLQCRFGVDCFVQSYPDAGGGRDHMCGTRSYPGHNGTDFRVKSMVEQRRGVVVRAVDRGRVLRVRDGEPDVSVRQRGTASVADRECGNGVVIAHRDGWESQYCHLADGSIRVRAGDRVRAGEAIGRIGLSGDTEFPHVHVVVRHGGRLVDPFAAGAAPGSCGGGVPLWKERVAYQAGEVLMAGFASAPVSLEQALEQGEAPAFRPTRDGPALVAFVEAIGLRRGDVQRIRLLGPDARVIADGMDAPLPSDRAVSIWNVGRKPPPGGWPSGIYQANYSVRRDGVDRIVRTFRIRM